MKLFFKWITCCLITFCLLPLHAIASDVSPTEQIKPVIESIMVTLADETLLGDDNKAERRAALMDRIELGFDFREMSKRILGKTWREISEEERETFTEQMTILLENTYMDRLEEYSGEAIHYVDERITSDRKAQVDTVVDDGKITIPVSYIMFTNDQSKWMVYDMTTEGVSLVRNYRDQFRSILRKKKFDGLIQLLVDKNNSFSQAQ